LRGITFILLLISFSALYSQPITLRDTTNQYDYIIITVPEFVNACEPFRLHKEAVRDFRTLIVDTTQIFAEFDSSATPQDNIRDFISYAGTFWKEPRPKLFLIVGTVKMVPNFPIPDPSPATIYYYSDYYYGVSTYDDDSAIIDFCIGRIPAKNTREIENYFNKVIDYESNSTLESWMNNAQFICQDNEYYDFLNSAFYLSSQFPSFIRPYYITENDTSQFYGNIDSIYSAINERGNSVVWFLGFSKDSLFTLSDLSWFGLEELNGLSNHQKYFFTFFLLNQSSIIDSNTNLTREMIVMQNAGSLGGTVFVGITFWGINWLFQQLWAQRFFDPSIQSISEVTTLDSLIPLGGAYDYMKKITNLWADPSLKLKYDTTVGVETVTNEIPQSFTLYQNYPNPFNPSTTIKFALPVNSLVKINVYNSLGQLVETLVDKEMGSGYHEVNFDASRLASGVYLYQLSVVPQARRDLVLKDGQAGEYISVRKMALIK
jgi:hypothetical protein